MSTSYTSDLTDEEWAVVEKIIYKRRGKQGRPPPRDARRLWDGIFYITKNGCF
ncbi:transposase [Candidatus Sarmatiella mevalonica]|uniref:transposase n=1 Tax=Candidatus Sarmatiella mevalonica TaxID=2770581 RepID=UPI001924398C|nr:transposase [Candidatus Sarmatiella mevalonica]